MIPNRSSSLPLSGILLAALLIVAVAVGVAGPAHADRLDAYRVADVEVSGKGSTAAQAKDRAIAAGRARAFATLLGRLTLPEDSGRLPSPPAAEIRDAEQGFEVVDERGSGTTYSGVVSYRFDPAKVRGILERSNVPFVDSVSQPVLVLAVWRDGERPVLWDDPNPWRVVWDRFDPPAGLVPFVKARGDLEDLQAISAAQAAELNRVALGDMARRYGASTVLVATGSSSGDGASVEVEAFNVATGRHEIVGSYTGPRNDGGFRRIAGEMLAAFEARWKQANLVPTGPTTVVLVEAPLDGLDYWIRLRDRIGRLAPVRSTRVIRLSPQVAVLELTYAGGLQRMVEAAAQNGLMMERRETLEPSEDGPRDTWVLRMAGSDPVRGPTVREIPVAPPPDRDDGDPLDRDPAGRDAGERDPRDRDPRERDPGVDVEWKGEKPAGPGAPRRP